MGAPTGSPAPPVHRHTSHHTHHPLSARLTPPHKLRRLPPTAARQTTRKRKKEKTSAPPSEGTPPIQVEGGTGVDEEEEEEEEEGESEAEPAEPPPPGSPPKAKVGTPEGVPAAQGGARRGGEAWQWGIEGLGRSTDPGHTRFIHSFPSEVTRMTVPASPGGPPSPSPCPRWARARTRAPNTRSGTGPRPSPAQVPS